MHLVQDCLRRPALAAVGGLLVIGSLASVCTSVRATSSPRTPTTVRKEPPGGHEVAPTPTVAPPSLPAPTVSVPDTSTSGPSQAGNDSSCPSDSDLLAAWSQRQDPFPGFSTYEISAFVDIQCWKQWVVATSTSPASGQTQQLVFSESGGLHAVNETTYAQFISTVCTSSTAPSEWAGKTGPAECSTPAPNGG